MKSKISESILLDHTTDETIQVGEVTSVRVDLMICDDLATARALELFKQMDGKEPLNKDKILVTCEHFTPPSTFDSAKLQNDIRHKGGRITNMMFPPNRRKNWTRCETCNGYSYKLKESNCEDCKVYLRLKGLTN